MRHLQASKALTKQAYDRTRLRYAQLCNGAIQRLDNYKGGRRLREPVTDEDRDTEYRCLTRLWFALTAHGVDVPYPEAMHDAPKRTLGLAD